MLTLSQASFSTLFFPANLSAVPPALVLPQVRAALAAANVSQRDIANVSISDDAVTVFGAPSAIDTLGRAVDRSLVGITVPVDGVNTTLLASRGVFLCLCFSLGLVLD